MSIYADFLSSSCPEEFEMRLTLLEPKQRLKLMRDISCICETRYFRAKPADLRRRAICLKSGIIWFELDQQGEFRRVPAPEEFNGNIIVDMHVETLSGLPKVLNGNLDLNGTHISSLEGCPEKITGEFSCEWCENLISLKGGPREVSNSYDLSGCKNLTSLEGLTANIGDTLFLDGRGKLPKDEVKCWKEKTHVKIVLV